MPTCTRYFPPRGEGLSHPADKFQPHICNFLLDFQMAICVVFCFLDGPREEHARSTQGLQSKLDSVVESKRLKRAPPPSPIAVHGNLAVGIVSNGFSLAFVRDLHRAISIFHALVFTTLLCWPHVGLPTQLNGQSCPF